MHKYTYFITDGQDIKIGVSNNPSQRLKILQPGNPRKLTILLKLNGDREAEFHNKFHKYRLKGEWFSDEGELSTFLKEQLFMNLEEYLNLVK